MIISKINTFKLEASKPKIARVIETKVATWLPELLKLQNISRIVVPEGGPPQGWWWPWCGICRCRRSRGGTPAWRTPRSSSSSPPCWSSTPRSRPAWAQELLWNNPQATLNRIIVMIICILENVYANHCHSIFRWPLSKSHVMLMLDLERSILGNNLKSEIKLLQNLTLLPIYHQNQLQCLHYCQNLLQCNHLSQDYEPGRARCQGPRTRERQKRNWKMTTINHCCIFSFRTSVYAR